MGYIIGVSSGFSDVYLRRGGGDASLQRITFPGKAFYGAFHGVQFVQIDLETLVEFMDPNLVKGLERIRREQKIEIGIHGEMGGVINLDVAKEQEYINSHKRFLESLEKAKKCGAKYLLLHASEAYPISRVRQRDLSPCSIVDIWGRRMHIFLEEIKDSEIGKKIIDWVIKQKEFIEMSRLSRYGMTSYDEALHYFAGSYAEECIKNKDSKYMDTLLKVVQDKGIEIPKEKEWESISKLMYNPEINMEIRNRLIEEFKPVAKEKIIKELFDFSKTDDMIYGPEYLAYLIIAKWMSLTKDPLWLEIVGNKEFDEDLKLRYSEWVPAVAAKYIWGHFNLDKAKSLPDWAKAIEKEMNISYDPKKLLDKEFYFVIETGMADKGMEEEMRLSKVSHMIALAKHISTPYFGVVLDFEHSLGAGINIDEELDKKIKNGDAKYVKVLHVGFPTPLQPAHVPIPLCSEEQELLYRWMFKLRKKGWDESEDRYIIFERAGGVDPVKETILVLRKIVEFLRKDKPIEEMSNEELREFFGFSEEEEKREEAIIRMHAFEPIRGLLTIPEEKHTFLGRSAIEKGKIEEWRKEEFR